MNNIYGENDYFFISEEEKTLTKESAGNRRLIGYRAKVKDAFGEETQVEAIFFQPTVKEIKEFGQEQSELPKNNIASGLAFMNKWFKKMMAFPSSQSQGGVGLSDFLQYYPMVASDFLDSLFMPHLVSQIEDEQTRKKREERNYLSPFKV